MGKGQVQKMILIQGWVGVFRPVRRMGRRRRFTRVGEPPSADKRRRRGRASVQSVATVHSCPLATAVVQRSFD
jgi:hypothetical protein